MGYKIYYPIENNRGRIGGRWWAAVALRGALPEAHRGGAGEMSALSWEISTAAHRGPPKIYINKDKKGIGMRTFFAEVHEFIRLMY